MFTKQTKPLAIAPQPILTRRLPALMPVILLVLGAEPARAQPYTVQPAQRLTALQSFPNSNFGHSVSVDGDVAVIGDYITECQGIDWCGSAYVFEREGTTWVQKARLTNIDASPGLQFGWSVSISGDVIVVGALGTHVNVYKAYICEKPPEGWHDMTCGIELPHPPSVDYFGISVAIRGDTVVVGASYDEQSPCTPPGHCGAAYVYVRPEGGWSTIAEPTTMLTARADPPTDAPMDAEFGHSVAISDNVIVVGAYREYCEGVELDACHWGAAYVFEQPPTGWTTTNTWSAKLTVPWSTPPEEDPWWNFGVSVSISGDVVAVGQAPLNCHAYRIGAAYIFEMPPTGWADMSEETARLEPSYYYEPGRSCFGSSISIDGDKVAVGGGLGLVECDREHLVAYVFDKPASGWIDMPEETHKLVPGPGDNDHFGYSLGVSGDTVLSGAAYSARAYTYALDQQATRTFCISGDSDDTGYSWALSGSAFSIEELSAPSVPAGSDAAALAAAFVESLNAHGCPDYAQVKAQMLECFTVNIHGDTSFDLAVGSQGLPPDCLVTSAGCDYNPIIWGQVVIETVPVGNPGNVGENSGESEPGGFGPDRICGGVHDFYEIGAFEVTAGQYTEFLNAVAATDTYGLYNSAMEHNLYGCKIRQTGGPLTYAYIVDADGDGLEDAEWVNRPVNYVSWADAARFANWLHNGQPGLGAAVPQDDNSTEDGAYDLSATHSYYGANGEIIDVDALIGALTEVERQPDATWVIPSEDEWYKAAYHKNDGVTGNYYDYPTQSDTAPTAELPPGTDTTNGSANYYVSDYVDPTYYRTEVGAYNAKPSDSPHGTFDQGGNVWEWTEALIYDSYRGVRGGSFNFSQQALLAAYRNFRLPTNEDYYLGVRVARTHKDCNENGIPDECDLDCGPPQGPCDFLGCGQGSDTDGDGVLNECDMCPGYDDADPCPIPTTSAWGLVTMTLLVLSAGTVMLLRRRVAPA